MFRLFRLLFAASSGFLLSSAAEARVVRVATYNIENGPEPTNSADYAATKAVLARVNADIVAFQEIYVRGATNSVPVWQQMGAELGYAHVSVGTADSGTHRLGYFSRFPILQTTDLSSPANEFARRPMRVVVNVPGAAKPLVLWNMHHKAGEPQSQDIAIGNYNNQFRRAVEALRIVQDISAYRSNNPTHDEFVMLGDLNDSVFQSELQKVQFSRSDYDAYKADTALLPSSYWIGGDIQFPVSYRVFPDERYASAGGGLHRVDLRQQDGWNRATYPANSRTLDYILVSTALRDSPLGAPRGEVYNSQLDAATETFAHGFTHINEANADDFLVATSNVRKFSELQSPPTTYWGPVVNDEDGVLTYKFTRPGPIRSGSVVANLASFNFGPSVRGSSSVWVSRDGQNWVRLLDNPVPAGVDSYKTFDSSLPIEVLGGNDLWLQVRLRTAGTPLDSYSTAQFSRSSSASTTNVFEVRLQSSAAPGLPKAGAPLSAEISAAASDHLALFADVHMDDAPVPSVSITSPSGSIPAGVPTTIEAEASVSSGTIASVEFFVNGLAIDVDSVPPFSVPWTPPLPGIYALRAQAKSSAGVIGASPFALVTVTGPSIAGLVPSQGLPGTAVRITGSNLVGAAGVDFGGVPAEFSQVGAEEIVAIVPSNALTGPVSVSTSLGSTASPSPFLVGVAPAVTKLEFLSSLDAFVSEPGRPSAPQSVAVSADALPAPLDFTAPSGYEVSLDGTNWSSSVRLEAPPLTDSSANYGFFWGLNDNGGRGFGPWGFDFTNGSGVAGAVFKNPVASGVGGMGDRAFALSANPANSGANASAWRSLERPLAVGEALSFDWGINWDANSSSGGKGFSLKSGSSVFMSVAQYGWPGTIYLHHGSNTIDTGIAYGTNAMRWTFRQMGTQTLGVTATSRLGDGAVSFSTNLASPGAVTGFVWSTWQMAGEVERLSFYDNLTIEPISAGGGKLPPTDVYVRLNTVSLPEEIGRFIGASTGGSLLALYGLSGNIMGGAYGAWLQSFGLGYGPDGEFSADPDGDGHFNGLEFAFGTSPVNGQTPLLQASVAAGMVKFQFLARQSGYGYFVRRCTNLKDGFGPAADIEPVDSASQAGVPEGWVRREFSVPATGSGFYRVEAVPQ